MLNFSKPTTLLFTLKGNVAKVDDATLNKAASLLVEDIHEKHSDRHQKADRIDYPWNMEACNHHDQACSKHEVSSGTAFHSSLSASYIYPK